MPSLRTIISRFKLLIDLKPLIKDRIEVPDIVWHLPHVFALIEMLKKLKSPRLSPRQGGISEKMTNCDGERGSVRHDITNSAVCHHQILGSTMTD